VHLAGEPGESVPPRAGAHGRQDLVDRDDDIFGLLAGEQFVVGARDEDLAEPGLVRFDAGDDAAVDDAALQQVPHQGGDHATTSAAAAQPCIAGVADIGGCDVSIEAG